jgi:hypothetical protein
MNMFEGVDLDGVEIDESTGLAAIPRNMYWKVRKSNSGSQFDYYMELHQKWKWKRLNYFPFTGEDSETLLRASKFVWRDYQNRLKFDARAEGRAERERIERAEAKVRAKKIIGKYPTKKVGK